jgi:diguanylate cyclase (GGDEF)-like protein/PAS domain S-box-containing protein
MLDDQFASEDDHAWRESDRAGSESDRAGSDSDQTRSDADQTAADGDEAASEGDQAASDQDQEASDRDLEAGGDRDTHHASAEQRNHGTQKRERGSEQRSRGAAVRDEVANARDRAAEARDAAAERRDRDLERRAQNAADRARAASWRKRAAADRERAAEDRWHAAEYRLEAREERAALLRQVAVSETDALTGARARAPGLKDLEEEINRAVRAGSPLAVAYVDVAGLKAINDSRGHSAGDVLLTRAVAAMRDRLRSYDTIVRVGGDEFVCVLSGATLDAARVRLGQIQADAAAAGFGIKFGIATLRPGDSASDLIERADAELLPTQATPPAGRRLRLAPPPVPESGRPRIMVTDDRPELLAVVDSALGERYLCDFAADVEEAGEILAGNAYDLLLCDLASGGAPALDFARQTIEGDLDTAVVLLAGEDDPAEAERVFEFGAFGYVVRPLPGQLLIATMNALRRRDLEIAHAKLSRNREDRRQAILDMVPIGIYAKDRSGRYVVANAKAEAMMRRGELLGKTDDVLMSAAQAESHRESDLRVLEGDAVLEREDSFGDNGDSRTFKTTRFPLLDELGGIVAVGGVAVDVTTEREAIRLRDESIEELRLSRQETVERLARAIDRHDASTGEHVHRLAALTSFLGKKLGFDPARVDLLGYAAPMHDVGKIGTPDQILRKPGPLTAEERAVMERHTTSGYEILADSESDLLRLAATIALTHHERWDGSGYPNGLVGREIPVEGRITAVADVFDALLSDRVYRPAFSVEEAVALLEQGRGTQFDSEILDLLLENLEEALELRGSSP